MSNRMISFGYGVKNGKVEVIPEEAKIVEKIFQEYVDGKLLREIATGLTSHHVYFSDERCEWNKNMVDRIIKNGKYVGEKGYPAIIELPLFNRANLIKSEKGNTISRQPETVQELKEILYCSCCGAPMRRRSRWGLREKWMCDKGCIIPYIDDKFILTRIMALLDGIEKDPELLVSKVEGSTYQKTQDIIRRTNEINCYLNDRLPSFQTGKKLILACAARKFESCCYRGDTSVKDSLLYHISRVCGKGILDKTFFRETVERIVVNQNGDVAIRFWGEIEVPTTEVKHADAE